MTAEGFWLSVSDLAAERGIDKATVSRRVKKFADAGLVEVRRGPGGTKLVNVAAFDKASHEALDGLAVMAGETDVRSKDPTLAREQARRTAYMADLAQLDLAERTGKLIPVAGVEAALERAGGILIDQLQKIPGHANELHEIAATSGAHGLRVALRDMVFRIRTSMAENLAQVARTAEQKATTLDGLEDDADD